MTELNHFVPTMRDFRGDRRYKCGVCGWETPWVHDGQELQQQINQHVDQHPACGDIEHVPQPSR